MNCDSQNQADRVAAAGAKKMEQQAYTWKQFRPFLPLTMEKTFLVTNPDHSHTYTVNLHERRCNCPFFQENASFQTCKHLVFMENERDYTLEIERQAELFEYAEMLRGYSADHHAR